MSGVLFITKQRSYPGGYGGGLSSGLFNSARFVSDMLRDHGIASKTVDVVDNNGIDREVKKFKPTHVFIEALWVVPEKFDQLAKLHPGVKWVIRLHSNPPFIATEGPFTDWTLRYLSHPNVYLNANSPEMYEALKYLLNSRYPAGFVERRLSYLPNFYPLTKDYDPPAPRNDGFVDIGCFGAIRPLKNQVGQAIAALEFADSINRRLRLHLNVSRVEGKGEPILKNLRNLFAGQSRHLIVEHEWMPHGEFKRLVKKMDLGLQVSFSETFNIVAADFADSNVPLVGSDQIPWLSRLYVASPVSISSMVSRMRRALTCAPYDLHALNKVGLCRYNKQSVRLWLEFVSRRDPCKAPPSSQTHLIPA